ncbi:helix-turn-helix domain-containing protein [Streptomyces rapamycinicus]|uniref:helix-turn-helix domain-containing protein n=1 Tax=Streptomyces rapamycinicus TaxID=1226757 RepID=UPI0020C941CE|nr:helix-turn-helix transcriptional regulator [Streptomyces rapamycinicus]UTP33751.1 helix-turn-helix transcriptional regulator [Streptomyces rapamycinicus NRRL 5491]
MGQRAATTARQRRIGTELRKMRERAGMSVAEAGEHLGVNRTRISNIEAARFGVSEERIRTLATIYSCMDRAYVDALVAMNEERGRGWWEDYRGRTPASALDLVELEHHAVAMRSAQIMHVPGLLQTEDYAKAVFATATSSPTAAQLRASVSYRLRRRDVLDRDDPPHCTFFIHEAALRMRFGGPKVMRGQLEHLIESSERGNLTVQVVPFSAGGFSNPGISMLYVSGPVRRLDTVQADTPSGSAFLDSEAHLERYGRILDQMEALALTPEDTVGFVHEIAQQL